MLGGAFLGIAPLLASAVLRIVTGEHRWELLESASPFFLLTVGSSTPGDTAVSAASIASTTYGIVGAGLVALTFMTARRKLNRST